MAVPDPELGDVVRLQAQVVLLDVLPGEHRQFGEIAQFPEVPRGKLQLFHEIAVVGNVLVSVTHQGAQFFPLIFLQFPTGELFVSGELLHEPLEPLAVALEVERVGVDV